jgi:hypothetical protein
VTVTLVSYTVVTLVSYRVVTVTLVSYAVTLGSS